MATSFICEKSPIPYTVECLQKEYSEVQNSNSSIQSGRPQQFRLCGPSLEIEYKEMI